MNSIAIILIIGMLTGLPTFMITTGIEWSMIGVKGYIKNMAKISNIMTPMMAGLLYFYGSLLESIVAIVIIVIIAVVSTKNLVDLRKIVVLGTLGSVITIIMGTVAILKIIPT